MNKKSKTALKWLGWGLGLALALSACSTTGEVETGAASTVVRKAPQESRSIAITNDGKQVVTANIDVATISVVNAKERKVSAEIAVGKEPRSVALSPDNRIAYVTAMQDDRV